jgi:hypothetical protein
MPDEEIEVEVCRYCGQHVLMMCRQKTGFCSEKCEEDFAERGVCRGDGEANCFCRED